jgi:PAS domain S-box-containing protein
VLLHRMGRASLTDTKIFKSTILLLWVVPLAALLGWATQTSALMSLGPQLTRMNPLTAVCFLLLGASLATYLAQIRALKAAPAIQYGAPATVFILALARLIGYILNVDGGPDTWLFTSAVNATEPPNRMAGSSAVAFLFASVSLLAQRGPKLKGILVAELAATACTLLGLWVATSYAYSAMPLSGESSSIPMALNTALLFGLFGVGVLVLGAKDGIASVLVGATHGSALARKMVFAAVAVPWLLGAVRLHAQHVGLFTNEVGTATFGVASIAILTIVIWLGARRLNFMDAQRDRAERSRESHRRFLRDVIDTDPNLIAIRDASGKHTLINQAYAEAFGMKPAQVLDTMLEDLCDEPSDLESWKWGDDQVLGGVRVLLPEQKFKKRWLITVKMPIQSEDSLDWHVLSISTDITDLKRAEQEAAKQSIEVQDLYKHAPCGYHSLDSNGLFVRVNDTLLQWLGYTAEEVLHKMRFSDLITKESQETFRQNFPKLKETGSVQGLEFELIRKDGSLLPVLLNATALYDENGAFVSTRSSTVDISKRMEIEALTEQARNNADQASLAKSEFLSRMSHELRTPLNSVLGFAQLLDMRSRDDRDRECVQQILKGGAHLLRLINEVLDISRIESGNLSISLEPVDAKSAVKQAFDLLKPLAEEQSITLNLHGDDEPCYVRADRQRLVQVLLNLLSNALKYNRNGGSVTVSISAGEEDVRIDVADTGVGIPREGVSKLFTPFERIGAETTAIQGTGLGLALSQKLTVAMGGSLHLKKTSDQGSVFCLRLDQAVDPVPTSAPAITTPTLLVQTPSCQKVLYIEDNISNIRLIEQVFEARPGYELVVAMSGSLGLQLASDVKPDLILLDLHLPDMEGSEVISLLKRHGELMDIPVIVLSADATPRQIERLTKLGASRYLPKPLNIAELLEALDYFLQPEEKVA